MVLTDTYYLVNERQGADMHATLTPIDTSQGRH